MKKTANFFVHFRLAAAFLLAGLFAQGGLQAQSKWQVDKAHSTVKFSVQHLVISEVEGSFRTF
ncbi:MAG TPA: hypothetical protein PLD12_05335, partial [Bacteroidales bacterium]|nr:hypothetical protein [Bacteroidales bacterium]